MLKDSTYPVPEVATGALSTREAPALNALNERLRDAFVRDTIAGVGRWNRALEKLGVSWRISAPHKGFNRRIGAFSGVRIAPDGRVVDDAQWRAHERDWLPTEEDRAYVASLMGRVVEPGKFASWIAPPATGINNQPVDYQYVRFP